MALRFLSMASEQAAHVIPNTVSRVVICCRSGSDGKAVYESLSCLLTEMSNFSQTDISWLMQNAAKKQHAIVAVVAARES